MPLQSLLFHPGGTLRLMSFRIDRRLCLETALSVSSVHRLDTVPLIRGVMAGEEPCLRNKQPHQQTIQ